MNAVDIILIAAIVVVAGLAVYRLVSNKRKGKCSCGCDCGCCGQSCGKKK